jgi:hypothetical protein
MGNGHNPSTKAGLFSVQQSQDASSSSASGAKSSPLPTDETAAASSQSYALPKNLPSAIRYLDDDQLDRLLAAVLAEQRRRGKKVPVSDKSPRKALLKVVALRTVTAHAQGMGRSQKGELKKEHQAKKKEDQEKRRRLRTHTKTHLELYPSLVKSLTPWENHALARG